MPRITQLASILNGASGVISQVTGAATIANEDLSNLVEVGREVLDFTGANSNNKDAYIKALIDQVGKIMFVDRVYASKAPSIMMDGWEYGSVLEKVRCELPTTRDNASWDLFNYARANSDPDGAFPDYHGANSYPDPFELSKPDVKAKFFNSKATYEVPITLTDYQMRTAFQSAEQLSAFVSMIENRIRMKMTLSNDALIMATIDNLIGLKMAKASKNVINLLALYNAGPNTGGTPLTAAKALTDKDFLRFSSMIIAKHKEYLAYASQLYNEGSYVTFTPADRLKFVVNTEYAKALASYLYSDTYNEEFVKVAGYEEVAFWQATGTTNNNRLALDVTVTKDEQGTTAQSQCAGIVAVMFDRDAAAVCNQNNRVTSIWNPRGEYFNYFYKWDAQYLNDDYENCVVFVIDDYYTQFTKVGKGTTVTTAPSNWTTLDDKLFYLDSGTMTAAAGETYDKDTVYFAKNGDFPVDPT